MLPVNIFEAKSYLSTLVESIEIKYVQEIIIARHGRPFTKLFALTRYPQWNVLASLKGRSMCMMILIYIIMSSTGQDSFRLTNTHFF
jgi:antitoxin (DNA-binding transcriptional repressor) of toxin-antitoxin stability system